MALPIITVQNQTVSAVLMGDIGVTIPAGGQLTLTDSLFVYEILNSPDFHAQIDLGNLLASVDGVVLDSSAFSPISSSFDVFAAYDAVGGQQFTASPITVNLSVERFSSSSTFSLSSSEVTITETARYLVSYTASIMSSAGNRTQGASWLELNALEIPGTRGAHYDRQATYGASASHVFPFTLTSGDVLRMRAVRTVGTGTLSMLQNGSSLSLMRIG